jgi:hypothetical protein
MAINQNHLFEDLDGVKCAIVEKSAGQSRVDFLKSLLEFNGYKVVVVNSPPPKGTPAPVEGTPSAEPFVSTTFTVGVTDVRFNATNAIFGRLLKTKDGRVVTMAFWQQKVEVSDDALPYFQKN